MALSFIADDPSGATGDEWSPEGLPRRLAVFAPSDLDGLARALIEELVGFNRSAAHRGHAPTVEFFRSAIESVMPRLQARLEGATPPINRAIRGHAYLVEKLLKELAIAYARVVAHGPRSLLTFGSKRALHAPLLRAMDLLVRRLLLSYRLYARAPRGAWAALHELYGLAVGWQLAERDLSAPGSNVTSIYRKALLLAFAEPSRLPLGDLQRTRDYIARFGDAAELVRAAGGAAASGVFVLDPREDRPGTAVGKLRHGVPSERVTMLVTTKLVERLQQHLAALDAGATPAQLGLPQDPDPARYRDLLRRLATNWSGAARKRSARLQFRPRAELYVGFPGVWKMLESPDEWTGPASQAPEPVRMNEWSILNESPGGFALRYISGPVPSLRIGDIVGVRSRDRGDAFVCLVRWIQSEGAEHLDLGLQQLAPRFAPVTYRRTDAASTTHLPILFAPSSPQHNRVPVVVVPSRLLAPGTDFEIQYLGGDVGLHAERVLESTPHAELVQVTPR
jgi:cyclic-di-GMP-binding protein